MSAPKSRFCSTRTYGRSDRDGFIFGSRMTDDVPSNGEFGGRTVSGTCNTGFMPTPRNASRRELAEYVKLGVRMAGGPEWRLRLMHGQERLDC